MTLSTKTFNKRLESLRSERSSFIPVYKELSDYHLGYRGRFLIDDRNKGHRRDTKQLNSTSRIALRTLASGMMAGITSPSRPWFRLATPDEELNEYTSVKDWLHKVQTIMYRVFSQSNTYNSLHQLYTELGGFGAGALGVFEDFYNVIRCKTYTVGSYFIGSDGKDLIDTFYREYQKTVGDLVKEFGLENCSDSTKDQWEKGNTEAWVDVVCAIEPNDDRDLNSPMSRDKKIRSVYYEKSSSVKSGEKFLRRSGFEDFPIMTPRWDVAGEDVYATDCPGMIALGDTKGLQLAEKRMYQAIDMLSRPPLQGDSALKSKMTKRVLSGDDVLWLEGKSEGVKSIYGNYKPDINALAAKTEQIENRIKRVFYEDLFLMLSQSDRREITAREVAEKHEEKLLMLGPVLERLHGELLDPLINRTFNVLQRSGVLPKPPEELLEIDMQVDYVSILAQAQRLVSVTGIERLATFAGDLSAVWPEARFKIDAQQAIDDYSESLGVNPRIVRGDDEAREMIENEKKAQQQAAAAEQGQMLTQTAKTASEIKTDDENVLSNLLRNQGIN